MLRPLAFALLLVALASFLIPDPRWLELQVIDPEGRPLAHLGIEVRGGLESSVMTSAAGTVKLDFEEGTEVSFEAPGFEPVQLVMSRAASSVVELVPKGCVVVLEFDAPLPEVPRVAARFLVDLAEWREERAPDAPAGSLIALFDAFREPLASLRPLPAARGKQHVYVAIPSEATLPSGVRGDPAKTPVLFELASAGRVDFAILDQLPAEHGVARLGLSSERTVMRLGTDRAVPRPIERFELDVRTRPRGRLAFMETSLPLERGAEVMLTAPSDLGLEFEVGLGGHTLTPVDAPIGSTTITLEDGFVELASAAPLVALELRGSAVRVAASLAENEGPSGYVVRTFARSATELPRSHAFAFDDGLAVVDAALCSAEGPLVLRLPMQGEGSATGSPRWILSEPRFIDVAPGHVALELDLTPSLARVAIAPESPFVAECVFDIRSVDAHTGRSLPVPTWGPDLDLVPRLIASGGEARADAVGFDGEEFVVHGAPPGRYDLAWMHAGRVVDWIARELDVDRTTLVTDHGRHPERVLGRLGASAEGRQLVAFTYGGQRVPLDASGTFDVFTYSMRVQAPVKGETSAGTLLPGRIVRDPVSFDWRLELD